MYQAKNVYFICGFASIGKLYHAIITHAQREFPLTHPSPGGGLFGFDISSMSGVLATESYKRFFGNPVSYQQGGITASMPAGSLVGSLMSSFLADRLSRKITLQIGCVLWIVGSTIQCASQNVAMLCAGRVVAGLCVGIASSVVPVYQVLAFFCCCAPHG